MNLNPFPWENQGDGLQSFPLARFGLLACLEFLSRFENYSQQIEYSLKRFDVQLFRTRPEPPPCNHLNGAELWPNPLNPSALRCWDCGSLLPLGGKL